MDVKLFSHGDTGWDSELSDMDHDFYHRMNYTVLEGSRIGAKPQAILIQQDEYKFFLPYLLRICPESYDSGAGEVFDVVSSYGYPGFITNRAGRDSGFLHQCFRMLSEVWHSQGICSAFIRLHPILNDYLAHEEFGDWGFLRTQGNTVICDLDLSSDKIWQQTRESHRTKINKLTRQGFQASIVPSCDSSSLKSFIGIYEETMSRVNAQDMYYFTEDYFAQLVEALDETLHVCLVDFEGETVAASLIAESSGIVQYHLGGTKNDFLKRSPTTLMFDYIRNWAKVRGCHHFNLGGGLGSAEDSLYHFKVGFSKSTKSFMTMRMIVNEHIYQELVNVAAKRKGVSQASLLDSSFFPAYRG
jgi:Acetyltransferase (GNAT) domain